MKWMDNMPNAVVVNGDKPIISVGKTPMVYGSPWRGKENYGSNISAPLRAIVFMERSEGNSIEEISLSKALPLMLAQVHHPEDSQKWLKTIQLIASLDHRVRFYSFHFNNMKPDAFSVSYHELVEKQNEANGPDRA